MRPHLVVLQTEGVEPPLRFAAHAAPPVERTLQAAVEALHLALGLGMPDTAPAQPYALPHHPQRQVRAPGERLPVPPRRAMVHQHRLGHAAALECLLQLLPNEVAVQLAGRCQRHQIAAVVVDHRQRSDGVRPVLRPLEVHLPQLVGPLTLEALDRLRVVVGIAYQIVAQQNTVNRTAGQLHPFAVQQHLQLASTPVRILQA